MPVPHPTAAHDAVHTTNLSGLRLWRRGKVRDVYDFGDRLLIVATDRVSAYDVVMNEPIPGKGRILTALSLFWFDQLSDVVANHLITAEFDRFPEACAPHRDVLEGRSMLVHKTDPLPVECVARGYLAGSGWREYRTDGTVCSLPLRPGLVESDRLPEPIFTPATKAESGHDENISFEQMQAIVGYEADRLRDLTLRLYSRAAAIAEQHGIIIADTKVEFGIDRDGRLMLIDEVLTPDSSRFWLASAYRPGEAQQNFDKQYLRDWLDTVGWDHTPPPPAIPPDVVDATARLYAEALGRLTGSSVERRAPSR